MALSETYLLAPGKEGREGLLSPRRRDRQLSEPSRTGNHAQSLRMTKRARESFPDRYTTFSSHVYREARSTRASECPSHQPLFHVFNYTTFTSLELVGAEYTQRKKKKEIKQDVPEAFGEDGYVN